MHNLKRPGKKAKEKVTGESSETNLNQSSNANNNQNQVNSNSQNKSKKTEIDPFAPVKDNGMTDEIHAKHLKQVVFSKTSIEYKQGKEEQLTNTFNLGDEIYVMAYFEHSMKNQWLKDRVEMPDRFITFVNIWYEVNGQIVGKEVPTVSKRNIMAHILMSFRNGHAFVIHCFHCRNVKILTGQHSTGFSFLCSSTVKTRR